MTITKDTSKERTIIQWKNHSLALDFLESVRGDSSSNNKYIFTKFQNIRPYYHNKKVNIEFYNLWAENITTDWWARIIQIDKKHWISLHSGLSYLAPAIEESLSILSLKDDWDGEWSVWYSAETLYAAVKFLISYADWYATIWKKIYPPKIYHAAWGSIDLLWEDESATMLINILAGWKDWVFFTTDIDESQKIRWNFKLEKFNYLSIPFLFED